MGKEIVHQVQEAQRVQYRINPRRNTPRHILIKLSKWIKDLNIRPDTINLLEENIGRTLYDISHSKILLTHLLEKWK